MCTRVCFFVTRDRFFFLAKCATFAQTISSRVRTLIEDACVLRMRVSRRSAHEVFIRVAIHAFTVCDTVRAPGLGGILLSVRVSREDDNAHGIAVAPFSARLIARRDEVEASWCSCARIRPETRNVHHQLLRMSLSD